MLIYNFKTWTSVAAALACGIAHAGTFSIVGASLSFTASDSTQFATPATSSNYYTLNYGINYYLHVNSVMHSMNLWETTVVTPLGTVGSGDVSGGGQEAVAATQQWTVQWVPAAGETSPPSTYNVTFEFYGIAYAHVQNAQFVPSSLYGATSVSTIDGISAGATLTGTGTVIGGLPTAVRFSDVVNAGAGWTQVSPGVWQSTTQILASGSIQCSWKDQPSRAYFIPSSVAQDPQLNIQVRPILVSGQSVEPVI